MLGILYTLSGVMTLFWFLSLLKRSMITLEDILTLIDGYEDNKRIDRALAVLLILLMWPMFIADAIKKSYHVSHESYGRVNSYELQVICLAIVFIWASYFMWR